MRRHMLTSLSLGMLLVLAVGTMASASDHRRADRSGHPFVGLWIVDADTSSPEDPPTLLTVDRDGTLRLSDCCNAPAAGVWAPSGREGAEFTTLLTWGDEDGFIGFSTLRGSVELSADGESFAATYTLDLPVRGGGTSGELGPVTGSGARVSLDAMGEPVGPFPPVEPSAEEPEDVTPAASEGPDASPAPEA